MSTEDKQPKPGDMVVLVGLPPGFLDDLPAEEQSAISAMVGKPIKFCGIHTLGDWRPPSSPGYCASTWERVELEFSDPEHGMNHTLYVDPSYIRPAK